MEKNGLEFTDESLIFTASSCEPYHLKNFTRSWERFLKRINIKYKKPHREMLGHSSIQITEKYYIYVFPEDKSKTASLLDDLVL